MLKFLLVFSQMSEIVIHNFDIAGLSVVPNPQSVMASPQRNPIDAYGRYEAPRMDAEVKRQLQILYPSWSWMETMPFKFKISYKNK